VGQRVFNEGVDALLGALGVKDALGAETPTAGTVVGQLASLLSPLAMIGGLKRIKNPIRAFHGSPHDFDKFDLSKIGSGAGATARGRGLYFAENEAVARHYKPPDFVQTQPANDDMFFDSLVSMAVEKTGSTDPKIISAYIAKGGWPLEAKRASTSTITRTPQGKMYEVNIHAEPDQLQDWDHYRRGPRTEQGVEILKNEGKVGLHYPNDMTLGGISTDSRNYVIWDEDVIEILRKYGIVPPLAAAAAGLRPEPSHPPKR